MREGRGEAAEVRKGEAAEGGEPRFQPQRWLVRVPCRPWAGEACPRVEPGLGVGGGMQPARDDGPGRVWTRAPLRGSRGPEVAELSCAAGFRGHPVGAPVLLPHCISCSAEPEPSGDPPPTPASSSHPLGALRGNTSFLWLLQGLRGAAWKQNCHGIKSCFQNGCDGAALRRLSAVRIQTFPGKRLLSTQAA